MSRCTLTLLSIAILAGVCATSFAENGHPVELVAVLESGTRLVVDEVAADAARVDIRVRGTGLQDPVVDILGLDQLQKLEILVFHLSPQIKTYSFLSRLPHLRRLLITHGRPDSLEFIRALTELEVLTLEMDMAWNDLGPLPWPDRPIDLSAHRNLEAVEFPLTELSTFPRFTNVPDSLRYLNLMNSDIAITSEDRPWLDELRSVEYIFVWANEVEDELFDLYPNLTLQYPHEIMPGYWRR